MGSERGVSGALFASVDAHFSGHTCVVHVRVVVAVLPVVVLCADTYKQCDLVMCPKMSREVCEETTYLNKRYFRQWHPELGALQSGYCLLCDGFYWAAPREKTVASRSSGAPPPPPGPPPPPSVPPPPPPA